MRSTFALLVVFPVYCLSLAHNHINPFLRDLTRSRSSSRMPGSQAWNPYHRRPSHSRLATEAIDDFVQRVMTCRGVPGMSVSVVVGGEGVMERGYGQADLRKGVPATRDTPFCVGSCTKAFTATLLGILLEENADRYPHKWDTRVADIMGPQFWLEDELRTAEATVKDVLAHRMGFPGYGAAWTVGLDPQHSAQDYCSWLWLLEATHKFRTTFAYSNFMYLLSACLAERLGGGASFEELVRDRILQPLGMEDSTFISQMEDLEGLPKAYIYNDTAEALEELDPILLRTVTPAEASGGLCSPAKDITKWLQFHLNHGRNRNGTHVLDEDSWKDMHRTQMHLGPTSVPVTKPYFPESDLESGYGLAWVKGSYRGYRYSRHSGKISGFESLVTVYDDLDLAIFTSKNGPMYDESANDVIHYFITDTLLGLTPWLDDQTACTFPEPWSQNIPKTETPSSRFKQRLNQARSDKDEFSRESAAETERRQREKELLRDHHARYEGQYGHLLFGNATITYDNEAGQLRGHVGNIGTGVLVSVTDEIWLLEMDGPLEYYSKIGEYAGQYPPLAFGDEIDGKYQAIWAIGFEPSAPPTFIRGLKWEDVPTS